MQLPRLGFPRKRRPDASDGLSGARTAKPPYIPPITLPPYFRERNAPDHISLRRFLVIALVGFCFVYGFAIGIFFPFLVAPLFVPLLVLAGLVIWALPDTSSPPVKALAPLLFAFIAGLIAWPDYVALALPGLPWITITRLIGSPLCFLFLVCLSTSSSFRHEVARPLNEFPVVRNLFVVMVILEIVSVVFSHAKGTSFGKLIAAQTNWTAIFYLSVYVFSKPGRAERMAKTLWILAVVVGLIALVEFRLERVIWAGHIPGFLKIQDDSVMKVLAGNRRLSSRGAYRAVSTFSTPLGLGEYMAITLPFVIHFAVGAYSRVLKLAATATIPFMLVAAWTSGARLGLIGCLFALVFYGGVWAVLNWRRRRDSLLAPAIVMGFGMAVPIGVAAIFSIGRLRNIVWGSGAQVYSDQARSSQLALGIPRILSHPWGYGIGMGGQALGFGKGTFLTIDNYFLSITLEYGVIGFFVYYGMFATTIFYSASRVLAEPFREKEFELITAAAISLTNFVIIKSVFSEEASHPVVFMILGMTVALLYRARLSESPSAAAIETRDARRAARPRRETRGLSGATS